MYTMKNHQNMDAWLLLYQQSIMEYQSMNYNCELLLFIFLKCRSIYFSHTQMVDSGCAQFWEPAKGSLNNNFRTLKGSQLFASKAQHMSVLWLQSWNGCHFKILASNGWHLGLHQNQLQPWPSIDYLLIQSSPRPAGSSQQVAPIHPAM